MQLIKTIFLLFSYLFVSNVFGTTTSKNPILVCYGRLDPEVIMGYKYVILESKHYSVYEIQRLKSQNDKVIAYISLGEINSSSPYFEKLKRFTLGKNETWNSYYLDLKSNRANEVLLEIAKNILAIGYDGLFLDNVDNFTSFGPQFEQNKELVALLKTIHELYPKQILIQNSGIEIIKMTASFVNAIAVESVVTNYTFEDKNYKLREGKAITAYINQLKSVNETYNLPIILIEYADTELLKDAVKKRTKSLKFDCFIGNIDLQTLPKFLN